jgi:hypothetical protein
MPKHSKCPIVWTLIKRTSILTLTSVFLRWLHKSWELVSIRRSSNLVFLLSTNIDGMHLVSALQQFSFAICPTTNSLLSSTNSYLLHSSTTLDDSVMLSPSNIKSLYSIHLRRPRPHQHHPINHHVEIHHHYYPIVVSSLPSFESPSNAMHSNFNDITLAWETGRGGSGHNIACVIA